jgi:hypothetical protein
MLPNLKYFLSLNGNHQQKEGTQPLLMNEEGERLMSFHQMGLLKCLCANEGGEVSLKDISENL